MNWQFPNLSGICSIKFNYFSQFKGETPRYILDYAVQRYLKYSEINDFQKSILKENIHPCKLTWLNADYRREHPSQRIYNR